MKNKNYTNMNVNPCKMCMPMGGSLAFKGIENSMILMHGSQGCATYIRRHMATHYNEPVDIASSSLSENQTVHGGSKNLKHGIKNVIKLYNPKIIGVLTTCLAETIGEDIKRIIDEFKNKHPITEVDIIPVSTPGYGATHYEGFFHTIRSIIEYYAVDIPEKNEKINIIAGDLTPADIRELKRIGKLFDVDFNLIPDISDTLDGSFQEDYSKIPKGGTTIDQIKSMSGAKATIELALLLEDKYSPGMFLEEKYGVKLYKMAMPIGLQGMDEFVKTIAMITGKSIPEELKAERERMLDGMIDSHKYNAEGKALIYGNPEITYSITRLCSENGITPLIVATGARAKALNRYFNSADSLVMNDVDFETIHSEVKRLKPNLLIGNSDGKFIWEKENIPLIRVGFPVHDHIGAQRKLVVGYTGSMGFLDEITNTLLDLKHKGYRQRLYDELYDKSGGEKYA
ncbi:MAG TPA: nitrogenase [Eubacteriaceae bacterium]|jgi:nitrogenase molybdenum-iron protein NifN|nr:nitrogenase [Eubacteriaceae bacterium]